MLLKELFTKFKQLVAEPSPEGHRGMLQSSATSMLLVSVAEPSPEGHKGYATKGDVPIYLDLCSRTLSRGT